MEKKDKNMFLAGGLQDIKTGSQPQFRKWDNYEIDIKIWLHGFIKCD